jgi:hypothetical protein
VSVRSRKLEEEGEAATDLDQFVKDTFVPLFLLSREITWYGDFRDHFM